MDRCGGPRIPYTGVRIRPRAARPARHVGGAPTRCSTQPSARINRNCDANFGRWSPPSARRFGVVVRLRLRALRPTGWHRTFVTADPIRAGDSAGGAIAFVARRPVGAVHRDPFGMRVSVRTRGPVAGRATVVGRIGARPVHRRIVRSRIPDRRQVSGFRFQRLVGHLGNLRSRSRNTAPQPIVASTRRSRPHSKSEPGAEVGSGVAGVADPGAGKLDIAGLAPRRLLQGLAELAFLVHGALQGRRELWAGTCRNIAAVPAVALQP